MMSNPFISSPRSTFRRPALVRIVSPATVAAALLAAAAPPAGADLVENVGTRASSAYTPDGRLPTRLTDGSGLEGDAHGVNPAGTMWLSGDGDVFATVEFDLGAVFQVASMRVWNYNEATNGLMSRGVALANIEIATELDDYSTHLADVGFAMAPGTLSDFSETIDLSNVEARFIRLTVLGNHGDASFAGLSEVQFDGALVAGQVLPLPASVSEVSSTIAGFNRLPQYLVDASGVFERTHSVVPDRNMWLAGSGDITPSITFDLGFVRAIERMLVWNYNETLPGREDLLNRGVAMADIQVSTDGANFSDFATAREFALAPGDETTQFAETIDMESTQARYVRINVTQNHGDASFTGLSEVQFFGSSSDTDGDSLPDGWELQFAADLAALDGLKNGPGPGEGTGDLDGDGLTDKQEFDLSQATYPDLAPNDPDSDDDTLGDGAEIAGAGSRPPTNPTNADTDNDGLGDLAETNDQSFDGPEDTGTDPTKRDTDGDRYADGLEVAEGTNPLDPNDFPVPALVGLWQFEEPGDVQPDLSGQGNDATVQPGATWMADGDRGGVMDFDGNDAFLEVADSESLSITGDITIAAWVNSTDYSTSTGFRSIVGKTQVNQPAPYDLYLVSGSGLPRFYLGNGAGVNGQGTGTAAPIEGEWHHIAVTRIGDTITHYLDGEFNGEGVVVTTVADVDGPLYIGNRADLFTDMFGQLDDVAIFNGGLSGPVIQEIMNGDFTRFGVAPGGSLFQIVSITRDEANGNVTIEWTSRPGASYAVDVSLDLKNWSELSDNVESEGETTSFTDTLFAPQAQGSLFYQVRKL